MSFQSWVRVVGSRVTGSSSMETDQAASSLSWLYIQVVFVRATKPGYVESRNHKLSTNNNQLL